MLLNNHKISLFANWWATTKFRYSFFFNVTIIFHINKVCHIEVWISLYLLQSQNIKMLINLILWISWDDFHIFDFSESRYWIKISTCTSFPKCQHNITKTNRRQKQNFSFGVFVSTFNNSGSEFQFSFHRILLFSLLLVKMTNTSEVKRRNILLVFSPFCWL